MFGEADAQTDPSLQLAESSTLPQPASIEVTRSARRRALRLSASRRVAGGGLCTG